MKRFIFQLLSFVIVIGLSSAFSLFDSDVGLSEIKQSAFVYDVEDIQDYDYNFDMDNFGIRSQGIEVHFVGRYIYKDNEIEKSPNLESNIFHKARDKLSSI